MGSMQNVLSEELWVNRNVLMPLSIIDKLYRTAINAQFMN